MNRILASFLEVSNIVVALFIISLAVYSSSGALSDEGELSLVGGIVGLVIGTVVAAAFCGIVAFLALIEKHLNFIATSAEYQNTLEYKKQVSLYRINADN